MVVRLERSGQEFHQKGDIMRKSNVERFLALAFASTMVMTLLAGCGSGSAAAGGTSTGAAAAFGSASSSGSARTVKVGVSQTLAPYVYLDDKGNLTGYDYDILKELDQRLTDYDFDYQPADFQTNLVAIQSGAIDMMVNNLVQSETRKKTYLFPSHYSCLAPMCLAVRKDSGITSLEDMAGKKINTNPASYEYTILQAYNEKKPDQAIDLVAVSDLTTADNFKQVSAGTVDAALTYSATYEQVMKDLDIDNLTTTDAVLCEDLYYMFNGKDADLCTAVDHALGELFDEGFMTENSKKWFGEDIFSKYKDILNLDFKTE